MENKYYTPSATELRVGFEIELLNSSNGTWSKYVFSDKDSVISFKLEEIRVKLLDSEDIKSLNWHKILLDDSDKKENYMLKISSPLKLDGSTLNMLQLMRNLENNTMSFYYNYSEGINKWSFYMTGREYLVKNIEIKNKYEFIQLMIMLNIKEDVASNSDFTAKQWFR